MWLAAMALIILRGRLQAYVPSSPAGSCRPAYAGNVQASDHDEALEYRRAGLLVVINANSRAMHGVRAEVAALQLVLDTEPPEARAHLAGYTGIFENHRAMIEALVGKSEDLRSELKQLRTSSGLQELISFEASCQAFTRESRMACDNALYVTRTLSAELARLRALPH